MPAHRRPSDSYAPTDRVPMAFRVRPALKARMEEAVAGNGRSLMSEIESRLEWSFDHVERLGGSRFVGLLEGWAQAITAKFGSGDTWLDDPGPGGYFAVQEAWQAMMTAARPTVTDGPRIARPAPDSDRREREMRAARAALVAAAAKVEQLFVAMMMQADAAEAPSPPQEREAGVAEPAPAPDAARPKA
jgi:hypothetical protein